MNVRRSAVLILSLLGSVVRADTRPIAIVGDTQRTMWVERLIAREDNSAKTGRLLEHIARHRPKALFHLGDAVECGGCPSWLFGGWTFFARAMRPVAELGIPMYLTVGNHEYWGLKSLMSRGITEHFPSNPSLPAVVELDGIAFVLLDANHADLAAAVWGEQRAWYAQTLGRLESDQTIRLIAVLTHQPPYSNSAVVGGDTTVREAFDGAFCALKKPAVWLSGHAHGYERFSFCGKPYIVSAGGGGPRQAAKAVPEWPEAVRLLRPRPLNFLLVTPEPAHVAVDAWGMSNDGEIRVFDHLELGF